MKKTNILYISKTMDYGGTEKVTVMLCEFMKNKFKNIVVASSGGVYEDFLYEKKIKHYKIIDFDNKNPLLILRNILRIRKIIKVENIDIIHSQHRMGTFISNISVIFTNIKVIHTAHNVFEDKAILMKTLRRNKIIAVGDTVKKSLINNYKFKNKNIDVIKNGISIDEFEKKNIEQFEEYKALGYFIVTNIGRICEQKGMKYFIDSIYELNSKNIRVKYFIVGDGPDKDCLREYVKDNGLSQDVFFIGFRKDILNIINQSDLLVLSSLWEGLPLTPIEAFSQKKTIIATNVDGTPEIVRNDYNGILVEKENCNQISDAIKKIYNNKKYKEELELNARNTYLNEFTSEIMLDNYLDFYYKLLEHTNG